MTSEFDKIISDLGGAMPEMSREEWESAQPLPPLEAYADEVKATPSVVAANFINPGAKPAPFDTSPVNVEQLQELPPRRWIYGRKLIRGFCTVIVSPGGVGKSAYSAAIACDLASNRNTLHDQPHQRCKSWIYNLEDPKDETLRKIAAIRKHKGLTQDDLDNIIVTSGRDRSLIVAEEVKPGMFMASPDVPAIIEACKAAAVDVLIVDPAVRAHRLPENDNKAIDLMMDQFARIAHEADIGVILVHHTRKGFIGGDMDSMRGASSMASATRVAVTLQTMTSEEAQDMNIPEPDRKLYVRVDNAKSNLAPAPLVAEWIKLESCNIDNATDEYPEGDFVQVATAWSQPDPWADIGHYTNAIIERIDAGHVDEEGFQEPFSMAKNTGERHIANAVLASFPEGTKSEKQAMAIVRHWMNEGILKEKKYKNKDHKTRTGVVVTALYFDQQKAKKEAENDIPF